MEAVLHARGLVCPTLPSAPQQKRPDQHRAPSRTGPGQRHSRPPRLSCLSTDDDATAALLDSFVVAHALAATVLLPQPCTLPSTDARPTYGRTEMTPCILVPLPPPAVLLARPVTARTRAAVRHSPSSSWNQTWTPLAQDHRRTHQEAAVVYSRRRATHKAQHSVGGLRCGGGRGA